MWRTMSGMLTMGDSREPVAHQCFSLSSELCLIFSYFFGYEGFQMESCVSFHWGRLSTMLFSVQLEILFLTIFLQQCLCEGSQSFKPLWSCGIAAETQLVVEKTAIWSKWSRHWTLNCSKWGEAARQQPFIGLCVNGWMRGRYKTLSSTVKVLERATEVQPIYHLRDCRI